MATEQYSINGIKVLRLTGKYLQLDLVPEIGGRIIGIKDLETEYQFLWKNPGLDLKKLDAGSEYDPNFYGGIDELLPNDMPEEINGVNEPDHGELWTLPLNYAVKNGAVSMSGTLPLCGLIYEKSLILSEDQPGIALHYKIVNPTRETRTFLWKFHAALAIEAGDEIICPAETAVVADLDYSRRKDPAPFSWPIADGVRADIIPEKDNTMDFLYLYNLREGRMGWRRPSSKLAFVYGFDAKVFPYSWYFASYGGFLGHYTAVLEPCTTMPISVGEAARLGQCSVLKPGEVLETTVHIYAGSEERLKQYL